jgi:hypothetical protein
VFFNAFYFQNQTKTQATEMQSLGKYLLIISLLFGLSLSVLVGQSALDARVVLYDQFEEIKMFKSLVKSFELKSGEELLMNVEVVGGKKLSSFVIEQPGTPFKWVSKGFQKVERGGFIVSKAGDYTFFFHNRGIGNRNVRIRIEKYPRLLSSDTMILEDIIITTTMDTLRTPYIDTLGLPDISKKQIDLKAAFDYKSISDSCISENLIDNEPFQYAVYWIGIGNSALRAYEELKSNPPPSWVIKGINEPLIAYAKGLTDQLPGTKDQAMMNGFRFSFQEPGKEKSTLELSSKNPPFYGTIPVQKAGKFQKIKLCLRNFNTTTKVPVYFYLAKFKLDKKENVEIIKRERIQEIFIKKPVKYYEPVEE